MAATGATTSNPRTPRRSKPRSAFSIVASRHTRCTAGRARCTAGRPHCMAPSHGARATRVAAMQALLGAVIVSTLAACASPGGTSGAPSSPPPSAPRPGAIVATYRHGVFLHHWLAMPMERVRGASNVPHTYAAPWFDEEDVAWLAEHGFDHILFAIEADLWLRPDGTLDDGKLAPFEAALG